MNIPYLLKRSARARTMRLSVYSDSRVVVTAPIFFGMGAIEKFVNKHAVWVERRVKRAKGKSRIRVPRSSITTLKKNAVSLVHTRCMHFSKLYGFSYNKISIRAQKTRWGSCSSAGNLSFNYKIAALPPHIVDYIIVHELCHLGEMNHSKEFWALVEKAIPNHKVARKKLRNTLITFC